VILTTLFKKNELELSKKNEFGVYQLGWLDGFALRREKLKFDFINEKKGITKIRFIYLTLIDDFDPNKRLRNNDTIVFHYRKSVYELIKSGKSDLIQTVPELVE
jgi:hypothetical protein